MSVVVTGVEMPHNCMESIEMEYIEKDQESLIISYEDLIKNRGDVTNRYEAYQDEMGGIEAQAMAEGYENSIY